MGVITGNQVAQVHGLKELRSWIKLTANKAGKPWSGKVIGNDPVLARIDFGRWLADCECGGAEYVDPADPIFYCVSCGNQKHGHHARPVIFPAKMAEIEALVMVRPVDDSRGLNDVEKAINARPTAAPFSRSWSPDETVEDLKAQNKLMDAVLKAREK